MPILPAHLHLKGVFSPTEMHHFARLLALPYNNAALEKIRTHPAVVDIATGLCSEHFRRTYEESINYNMPIEKCYTDWHRDYPFSEKPVPIFRFAVYFKDYTNTFGCINFEDNRNVISQPGDLIIWSLSTLHQAIPHKAGGWPSGSRDAVFFDYAKSATDELNMYLIWREKCKKEKK